MAGTRFPFKMGTGPFGAGGPPALTADLSITKSDTPDPVASGGSLVYSIGPSNAGPDNATNVEVVDTLPAGVTFVSAVGTGWVCGEVGGVVTCTRAGPEGIGAMPMITITVTAPTGPTVLNNSVTVTADEVDPNPGTATAVEATNVSALPPAPTGIVRYSIGVAVGDISNGGNVSIAAGYATFDTPQPDNVGVGDAVLHGVVTSFISGRISSTLYSVIDAVGDLPIDVISAAVNSITREFATGEDAANDSVDASHLNSSDLTTAGTAGVVLQWPCYDDGPIPNDDEVSTTVYTTGSTNFIRMFAPFLLSDVGTSQRHTGTLGTGAEMVVGTLTGTDINYDMIDFAATAFARIEGMCFNLSNAQNESTRRVRGFLINGAPVDSDIRIDGCIIANITNDPTAAGSGNLRVIEIFSGAPQVTIKNTAIYNCEQQNSSGSSQQHGIRINSSVTSASNVFVHNCTIINFINNASSEDIRILQNFGSGDFECRNVFAGGFTGGGTNIAFSTAVTFQSNNVSTDTSSSGTGSVDNQSTLASYFTSATAGSEDVHLLNTSTVLWGTTGTDLSAFVPAAAAVVDDFDTNARGTPYDVGADQF